MPQDQFGDQVAVQFPQAIAMGVYSQFAGLSIKADRRTGYVSAPTAGTSVSLRPGTFTQQTSQAQRSLVSSSASDAPGQTGALTVLVNYLTNAMVLKSETVTMNGVTPVNMVATDVQFIENMAVATCGSSLTNVGNISLMAAVAGGGATVAQIIGGDGSTFFCHHYISPGVTCYVAKHTGSATLAAGRSLLVVSGDPRSTNLPVLQTGDIFCHLAGGSDDHEYESPLVIAGPNLIVARENPIATSASNVAYGGFDYVEF